MQRKLKKIKHLTNAGKKQNRNEENRQDQIQAGPENNTDGTIFQVASLPCDLIIMTRSQSQTSDLYVH